MWLHDMLIGFCLILCLSTVSAAKMATQQVSAYEMLEKFNFPRGILPEGVRSYVLHEDGSFEVFLDGDCKFNLEGGYSLSYAKKIMGKVSYGSLKELQGVNVKVLFVWFGISQVIRSGGSLDFFVGPLSASFPLSNFEESPRCGCGLICEDTVSDM